MFFRQGSLGRSIGGASHTRHLCGNKRGAGEGRRRSPSPRRACAIFIARTTPACYNNPPTPDLLSQSSGPRQSGAEASQPRLAPIRAQTAGFFCFIFSPFFFFLRSLRGAESKFAYAESTRIARPSELLVLRVRSCR